LLFNWSNSVSLLLSSRPCISLFSFLLSNKPLHQWSNLVFFIQVSLFQQIHRLWPCSPGKHQIRCWWQPLLMMGSITKMTSWNCSVEVCVSFVWSWSICYVCVMFAWCLCKVCVRFAWSLREVCMLCLTKKSWRILWVTQFVSDCWHRKLVCASKKSLWDFSEKGRMPSQTPIFFR
jgi:hypothetical protein